MSSPAIRNQISEAKKSGYSDEDIFKYLSNHPEYSSKMQEMKDQGISQSEFFDYLGQEPKPKELSTGEKIAQTVSDYSRLPMQATIGVVEGATLPYNIATGLGASLYNRKLQQKDTSIPGLLGIERSKKPALDLSVGGIFKAIGDWVGVDVTPKDTPEKIMRLTGLLSGFGEGGSKAVQNSITKQVEKVVSKDTAEQVGKASSNIPLAATAIIAEEQYGIPELVTFLGAAGARPLYEAAKFGTNFLVKEGTKRLPNLSKKYLLWDPKKMSKGEFDTLLENNHKTALETAKANLEDGIFTPQEYQAIQPYLKTAYEYGIPVNPSAVTRSPYFLNIEKSIAENSLTEEAANSFRQKASDQWANSYLNAIESMSKNLAYEEQGAVVDALKSEITTKLEKDLTEQASQAYDKSRQLFKDAKPISTESIDVLNDSLNKVVSILDRSLFPTSAETTTKGLAKEASKRLTASPREAGKPEFEGFQYGIGNVEKAFEESSQSALQQRPGQKSMMQAQARKQLGKEATQEEMAKAEAMKNKLFGENSKNVVIQPDGTLRFKRDIKPSELVNSIKSLNSTISWEYPEIVNLMKEPRKTIKDILYKEYGNSHKEALAEYEKGNTIYGKRADLFGQDGRFKKWGIKEDTLPEDLLKQLSTIDRIKSFEKEFSTTQQGKNLIDHLKFLKVRDELTKGFVKADYKPGSIAQFIQNIEKNPMMNYLMPKEVQTNLNKLKELDRFMFRRAQNFYKVNNPQMGDDLLKSWLKTKPLVLVSQKGKKAMQDRLSQVYSEILMNPEITSEYIRIGDKMKKAVESGNSESMRKLNAEADSLWQSLWESSAINSKEAVEKTINDTKRSTKATAQVLSKED